MEVLRTSPQRSDSIAECYVGVQTLIFILGCLFVFVFVFVFCFCFFCAKWVKPDVLWSTVWQWTLIKTLPPFVFPIQIMRRSFGELASCIVQQTISEFPLSLFQRGSWRGVLIPFPSKLLFFFWSQLKSHNPSLCCSNLNPIPIFYCFCFTNPSPSAQNPISQPLKKANPSSHFTPSRHPLQSKIFALVIVLILIWMETDIYIKDFRLCFKACSLETEPKVNSAMTHLVRANGRMNMSKIFSIKYCNIIYIGKWTTLVYFSLRHKGVKTASIETIYPYTVCSFADVTVWVRSQLHSTLKKDGDQICHLSFFFNANKTIEFMLAGINMFWALLRLILARAVRQELKWALRRAQNIFMPKNIKSITIIITLEGIERRK